MAKQTMLLRNKLSIVNKELRLDKVKIKHNQLDNNKTINLLNKPRS